MWTFLAPLVILVLVLLYQMGTKENFAVDASGNILDASGNPTSSSSNMIQLSLTDLLTLFKSTTPAPSTSKTSVKDAIAEVVKPTVPETSAQLYEKIRPSVLKDIKANCGDLEGAPYSPPEPTSSCTDLTDATAQGSEMMNAKLSLENNADYIRKDSIPCYGCSL